MASDAPDGAETTLTALDSDSSKFHSFPSLTHWRYVAAVVLLTRVVFMGLAYSAVWFFSSSKGSPDGMGLDIWKHWDANILLGIAEHGYTAPQSDPHATAFFPLFPLLIRAVSALGVSPLVAGLLINTVACIVALAYLSLLAEKELGSSTQGRRAVLYLAFFPTAVFLVAPYTEAVFLAGAIAAFYYARSKQWGMVAIPAAVACGARFAGVFLLLGLAVEFLSQRDFPLRKVSTAAVSLAVGALPVVAYSVFLWRIKGDPFYFFADQRLGWGRNFVGPVRSFTATWHIWEGVGYPSGWILAMRIEVISAIVGVGFSVWAAVRKQFGFAVFMGLTMAVLMTSAWYLSIPRMLLSLFPIPILLAGFTARGPHRHDFTLATLAPLAAFGVVVFARGAWFF